MTSSVTPIPNGMAITLPSFVGFRPRGPWAGEAAGCRASDRRCRRLERHRACRRTGGGRTRGEGRRRRAEHRCAGSRGRGDRGRGRRGPRGSGRGGEPGGRREPLCPRGRALRADRLLRRDGDGDRLRRGRPARSGRAAPGLGRQLLRPGARLSRPRCRISARAAARSSTSTRRSPTAGSRCRRPTAPRRQPHAPTSSRRGWSSSTSAPASTSRSCSRARSTRRSSTAAARSSVCNPSRSRRSTSRRSSPRPSSTAASTPSESYRSRWGAQKLLWGQKLSPRAGDLVLLRNGWKGQTTGEPKPVDSPDNLESPLPGDPGAHGRFDDRARVTSVWTAARLRLGKRGSVGACVAAALATLFGYHAVTKRRSNPL